MPSAQAATADLHQHAERRTTLARRPFTLRETHIIEALYTLGLTDVFIAMFLRRSTMVTFNKRCRIGLSRLHDDLTCEPLRPKFRMTREARERLGALEGPESWLCQCLDAFPQFVTNYAAGIANDSR